MTTTDPAMALAIGRTLHPRRRLGRSADDDLAMVKKATASGQRSGDARRGPAPHQD